MTAIVKIITTESHDWCWIKVNENTIYSGHDIPTRSTMVLLSVLGIEIEETTISDEDAETFNPHVN